MSFIGKFAKELKRSRLYRGFTQRDFARYLGVSPDSYMAWERGDCLPSFRNLAVILDKFKHFDSAIDFRHAYTSDKLHRRRKRRRAAPGK